MEVRIITVSTDQEAFNVPRGFEPFFVIRNAHEWVVFCRPTGA